MKEWQRRSDKLFGGACCCVLSKAHRLKPAKPELSETAGGDPHSDLSKLQEYHSKSIGVPHGVLGDIWVHLELKKGDKGDHWTSNAWERPHRSDTVKSL
ncbi:hypothetical protein F2Q70_00035829 [Brassica cretica]|uniref:Uncharacterized protein n=1 Tax=Brassica cretica TaxID=69181 RepID=A0A8S9JWJ0_BRACR|nr:hypothetical protein F2Q70_00035829 [Brassica cretica]